MRKWFKGLMCRHIWSPVTIDAIPSEYFCKCWNTRRSK